MQKIEIFSLLAYEYVFTLYNNSISIMIRERIAEKIHNGEWTSSFPRKKNHAQLNHAKYCWRFVSFECFKAFIEKSLKSPSCHHVFLHSLPYIDLLWEILMIFNAIDCNRDFPLYFEHAEFAFISWIPYLTMSSTFNYSCHNTKMSLFYCLCMQSNIFFFFYRTFL